MLNSAIVKLKTLTEAKKVYRGVSGPDYERHPTRARGAPPWRPLGAPTASLLTAPLWWVIIRW